MFLASLFILFYIVPTSGFVRAFIGVIIGGFGALFIGMVLFKVVGALLTGKAVYTVQDGYFKGKNKAVKIDEITDMKWWQFIEISGNQNDKQKDCKVIFL